MAFDFATMLPRFSVNFLSNLVNGIVLVVRAGSASRDMVRTALESMEGKNIIGIVFNGAEKQYSSYYSYAYGHDYGNKYYSSKTAD